jgi:hypothetical protein
MLKIVLNKATSKLDRQMALKIPAAKCKEYFMNGKSLFTGVLANPEFAAGLALAACSLGSVEKVRIDPQQAPWRLDFSFFQFDKGCWLLLG